MAPPSKADGSRAGFAAPPCVLILTYRPEDLPDGSLVRRLPARLAEGTSQLRLALGTLDPEQTGRLASSMLCSPENLSSSENSAELGKTLHRHTAGIPLAVEELVLDAYGLTPRGPSNLLP